MKLAQPPLGKYRVLQAHAFRYCSQRNPMQGLRIFAQPCHKFLNVILRPGDVIDVTHLFLDNENQYSARFSNGLGYYYIPFSKLEKVAEETPVKVTNWASEDANNQNDTGGKSVKFYTTNAFKYTVIIAVIIAAIYFVKK